jgi:hypothetical protein
MLEQLEEIENNYPVETIEFKGQKVWPYLRIYIASKLIADTGSKSIDSSVLKSFISSFFYGFLSLFRKYDFIYFSSSDQRKKTGTIFTDKSIDSINSSLGKGLVFEYPVPKHYKKKEIPTPNISSKFVLYFIILIFSKIFNRKEKIKNENVIKDIIKQYNAPIDYREIILRNWAQYKLMHILIKRFKPKAAFFVCYYTHMGYIKALNENGIKVIEVQHGVINKSHEAYSVFKKIDSSFYPNYIFTFGEIEKNIFNESNYFIDNQNVIPVGHFYLDFLVNGYTPDGKLKTITDQFEKSIAITSQNHYIEAKLIDFIIETAKLNASILYVFIPRTLGKTAEEYGFPKNVFIADWLNCYEIIAQTDFHSTVFSSCAIEAPSMGKQNILINLDALSKMHFGSVLTNEKVTKFVESPSEYLRCIETFEKQDRQYILDSNKEIITPNYLSKLKEKLATIIEE